MDQIVFIFDLESFLPSVLEEVDDSYLESTLCNVKKALLRILTHGRVLERRRDLSSFGFRCVDVFLICCRLKPPSLAYVDLPRFYSSTDYFSLPPQITGDWHDLCLASWDRLEDALRARLDSVLAAVTRAGLDTRSGVLINILLEPCPAHDCIQGPAWCGVRPLPRPRGGDGPLQLGPARPLLPHQDGRQVRGQVRQLRVRGDAAAGRLGPAPPVPGLGRRQAGQAQGHPREHIEQESQSDLHRRAQYLLTYY